MNGPRSTVHSPRLIGDCGPWTVDRRLKTMKTTFRIIAIGFLSGLAGSYAGVHWFMEPVTISQPRPADFHTISYKSADSATVAPEPRRTSVAAMAEDFAEAAERATPSVVYINSI